MLIIAVRYFIIAGFAWAIWYRMIRKRVAFRKIQLYYPSSKDYKREIFYSVITIAIFAAVPSILLLTPVKKFTNNYEDINQFGAVYFWIAFPLMFIIHDAYFYWMHRLMHHKQIFKYLHLVHHKSTNPSPWAAFAFHPFEALIEAGIFAVLIFSIPLHAIHLFVFFLLMIVYNVYGHLGWEIYPKGFSKHWLGKWINTSVNHNQHHQFFTGNYGFYFGTS